MYLPLLILSLFFTQLASCIDCPYSVYDSIESFLFFTGYPRSGHTLIASLINAHPNVMISNEINILPKIFGYAKENECDGDWISGRARWRASGGATTLLPRDRWEILGSVTESAVIAAVRKRTKVRRLLRERGLLDGDEEDLDENGLAVRHVSFDYEVPNAHQGIYTCLRVVGDKKGPGTVSILKADFDEATAGLQAVFGESEYRLTFLHVLRNPFDMIATAIARSADLATGHRAQDVDNVDKLDQSALRQQLDSKNATRGTGKAWLPYYDAKVARWKRAFLLSERLLAVPTTTLNATYLTVHLADLVADPATTLTNIASFLQLPAPQSWLDAASSIVFPSEFQSRHLLHWPRTKIEELESFFRAHPLLARYTFASD